VSISAHAFSIHLCEVLLVARAALVVRDLACRNVWH